MFECAIYSEFYLLVLVASHGVWISWQGQYFASVFGGRFCSHRTITFAWSSVRLVVCARGCSELTGSAQFFCGVYLSCRAVIAVPTGIRTRSMFGVDSSYVECI